MRRPRPSIVVILLLAGLGGCSSDPPAPTFVPTAGAGQGTGDGGIGEGGGASGEGGGFSYDAADPAKDAGYRDPRSDGGCAAPNKVCNGACVAVGVDVANCGQCGTVCAGPDAYCNAGRCACVGQLVDYCATGCMDVSSDVNNCGSCGFVCDPNRFNVCSSGTCDNQ